MYFYRIFMNDAQIGVLDASAFAIGLLAEVPSGALADKFGRAKIVKLGIVLAAIGTAGQAIGGFSLILVFQSIMMIGFAFMSGADEALFFDKLKFRKESVEWRKLITRAGQVAYAASIVGIPLGSFIYGFNHEIVFVLNGLVMLVSGFALLNIRDTETKNNTGDHVVGSAFREYTRDIINGIRIFRTKELKIYVPTIIALSGLFYIFDWGLLKLVLMDRFGFSEVFGGVLMSVGGILVIIVLHYMNKHAERLHEKRVLGTISVSLAAALLLSIIASGVLGVFVILIIYATDAVLYPFISEALNKHAPSKSRATVLSMASFIKAVPYIVLAPLIGWLNTIGRLDIFLLAWSILIAVAWLYYLSQKKRDTILHVDFE